MLVIHVHGILANVNVACELVIWQLGKMIWTPVSMQICSTIHFNCGVWWQILHPPDCSSINSVLAPAGMHRKAGSVLGASLASRRVDTKRRMGTKLLAIMDNASHLLVRQSSIFSWGLILPRTPPNSAGGPTAIRLINVSLAEPPASASCTSLQLAHSATVPYLSYHTPFMYASFRAQAVGAHPLVVIKPIAIMLKPSR